MLAQNDKRGIITAWKTNQSENATNIAMGGNKDVDKIVKKVQKGEQATPQELQYLADYSSTGKGNLVFSSNGELVNKQTGELVFGFNDLSKGNGVDKGNGYVDVSKTATNVLQFFLTNGEERAHNYTSNESIAKGAAKGGLGYFNIVSWLSGTSTINTNANHVSNVGGVNQNGQLTDLQKNWNTQYNPTNDVILNRNTQQAMQVKQSDMAFSLHFNKDGKATFINDGDYNAYRTNKDGSIAYIIDEDGNVIGYNQDNIIDYAEGFKLDIAKGKEKAFEDQMKTDEVQVDLMRLFTIGGDIWNSKEKKMADSFSSTLSSVNFEEFNNVFLKTQDGNFKPLTIKNADQINSFIKIGADDFTLNYLFASNLWKTMADYSTGVVYPTHSMTDAFDIKIDTSRITINPAVGNDNRTLANGTCGTSGCGQMGAVRTAGHEHQGNDYLILPGGYVLAVSDGYLYEAESNRKNPEKSLPSYVINNNNTGVWSYVLYNVIDPSIKNGTAVQQGGVIAKLVSQAEFDRVYNTRKDGTIIKPGEKGYTPLHLHNETKINGKREDNLPIVFPQKTPEPLTIKK